MKEEKYVYWVNIEELDKVIYPKRIQNNEAYGEFFMNYIVNSKAEAVYKMFEQLTSYKSYHIDYLVVQIILNELRLRTIDEFPELWI